MISSPKKKNPGANGLRVFCIPANRKIKLQRKIAPVIEFGFLRLAATAFAWLFVVAALACIAKGSFTIQFLFQTAQSFINRLTFF